MYWDVHVIQWNQTKRRYKNVLPQACRSRFVLDEITLLSVTESPTVWPCIPFIVDGSVVKAWCQGWCGSQVAVWIDGSTNRPIVRTDRSVNRIGTSMDRPMCGLLGQPRVTCHETGESTVYLLAPHPFVSGGTDTD